MSPTPIHPDDLISAYADGVLNDAERAAFEQRLESEPALRAELERHERAMGALRDLYNPDAPRERTGPAQSPVAEPPAPLQFPKKPRRTWQFAAAAVILLALIVGNFMMRSGNGPSITTPEAVYRALHANGFRPDFVCTDNPGFIQAVRVRMGQGLMMTPASLATGDISLVGWAYGGSYSQIISPATLVLMAHYKGQEVLVLIDHISVDRALAKPESADLHMFKSVVGNLVLYEVSPLSEPVLLPHLVDPDQAH
ncbi:MAG TPA: hypothetical protein VG797_01085 [Phycisphaerales bacterium]|nr:hypothetical protein [Phycisphaerales bacterium]